MCRFVLYLGPPLRPSALVTEPSHSLIRQSVKSTERVEPTNGDGFGLAWYGADPGAGPLRFRSVTPAWSNANLRDVARGVESGCILAHVRASSRGFTAGEANCHPFRAGRWAFMHNGDLGGFDRLRRSLLADLSDEAFALVEGQTDSEHVFAALWDRLRALGPDPPLARVADAVATTIHDVVERSRRVQPGAESYLNFALSDGRRAVVTRFTTLAGYAGESLYVSQGANYVCLDGVCRMLPAAARPAVLVSSEPLSDDPSWRSLARNTLLSIDVDGTVEEHGL